MSDLDVILAAIPAPPEAVTAWGVVTVASPLQVKFAGDTAAVRVTQKSSTYTPVVNDVVGLIRFGSKWVAVLKFGAA